MIRVVEKQLFDYQDHCFPVLRRDPLKINNSAKAKLLIKFAVSVLTAVIMALVAELLGEPEIIFPEVAALTVGAFISDKLPWNVTPVRMFALMSAGAVIGYLLSAFAPVPLYVKALAAFALCVIILSAARCTMLPMISAAVLPVLTSAQSLVYPISVLLLTAMIIGIRLILEKNGLVQPIRFENAKPEKLSEIIRICWLVIGFAAVAGAAMLSGMTFVIAPPLAVIFAEAAYTDSPVHSSPFRFFFCTVLCAFTGTACRLIFSEVFALPMTAGIFAAVTAAVGLLLIFRRPFPPAAALAVLPFILPDAQIAPYPFEAAAGALVFIALDMLYKTLFEKGVFFDIAWEIVDILDSMRIVRPEKFLVTRTADGTAVMKLNSPQLQDEHNKLTVKDLKMDNQAFAVAEIEKKQPDESEDPEKPEKPTNTITRKFSYLKAVFAPTIEEDDYSDEEDEEMQNADPVPSETPSDVTEEPESDAETEVHIPGITAQEKLPDEYEADDESGDDNDIILSGIIPEQDQTTGEEDITVEDSGWEITLPGMQNNEVPVIGNGKKKHIPLRDKLRRFKAVFEPVENAEEDELYDEEEQEQEPQESSAEKPEDLKESGISPAQEEKAEKYLRNVRTRI